MDGDDGLLDLLRYLKKQGYSFHAVTPATHARVLARELNQAPTLRDVFGWNRPFRDSEIDPELLRLMKRSAILRTDPHGLTSALRVASLGGDLFFHSAYPTDEAEAVFFGPDTYRFARFIRERWPTNQAGSVIDMGAGSGAGGIASARLAPKAAITLVDLNPRALRLARVNARAAGVAVDLRQDRALPTNADVVVANPPYMIDNARRSYRDGGDLFGGAVALDWAGQAMAKLAPGATLLLYTGVAVVAGASPLVSALERACADAGALLEIEEIDPDVFGEELEQPVYAEVERIAAIGVVIRVGG
ncbi:MAG TPA: methyltransferase [Croceibacterium sp.]|jgi:methylase of polypeptide subunit release factors